MIKNFTKNYFDELKKILDRISLKDIEKITDILRGAYKSDRHIFIIGNGGSAATASHFACDLGKGTLSPKGRKKIKRFKVTSLTDNVATMTAWSNDVHYDYIFSEQLKNLLTANDVVIALSVSGNSPNILNAVKLAKKCRAKTIGITGFDGGNLSKIANVSINAQTNKYDVAEDIHLILSHIITRYFFETINKASK